MIFVTVGHELGFNRLIRAVDGWSKSNPEVDVFAQIGATSESIFIPENFESKSFLTPEDFTEYFSRADLIVSHAGMGTIISALTKQVPIVIMPRRGHLKETRNDHQYATVKRFRDRNGIYVAEDESQLAEMISLALAQKNSLELARSEDFAEESLINFVRDFILRG